MILTALPRSLASVPASRLLLAAAVLGGATLLGWVVAGHRLIALLDRVTTAPVGVPTTPTWYALNEGNDASFDVGGTGDTRAYAIGLEWRVVERPPGHVSLETPEGSIVLGTITRCCSRGGDARRYEFIPEPGDSVTLTRRRSRVPWPRPFAFNFLGSSAWWGRYVYHRLTWRKSTGARLDVVWRDEQRFLARQGWIDQYMSTPPITTLRPGR
jgi:hypothetical protein